MAHQREQDLLILGKAVRSVREQHGLSVRDLAAVTGIADAQIVALEDGQLDPDFELLLTVAERMGTRPSAFFLRAEELRGQGDEGSPAHE